MMEASEGAVLFDGVDIKNLGLLAVRNAISIIPQEPGAIDTPVQCNAVQ